MKSLTLRAIKLEDCVKIHQAFLEQGWKDKPVSLYENYFQLQKEKTRDIIIAEYKDEFAGYLTINWTSDYPYFKARNIPEVVDFNVLKKYQRKGIGTALMDEAENRIRTKSPFAGIGVGMYKDYGPAQVLYTSRNYILDGNGLQRNMKPIKFGEQITFNDELTLYFIKDLKK